MAQPAAASLPGDEPFLFSELPIGTPLEEFDRVFEKKLRSFETSNDPERAEPYRQAHALGRKKLRECLGEDGDPC